MIIININIVTISDAGDKKGDSTSKSKWSNDSCIKIKYWYVNQSWRNEIYYGYIESKTMYYRHVCKDWSWEGNINDRDRITRGVILEKKQSVMGKLYRTGRSNNIPPGSNNDTDWWSTSRHSASTVSWDGRGDDCRISCRCDDDDDNDGVVKDVSMTRGILMAYERMLST
jgi:hypothetical protein